MFDEWLADRRRSILTCGGDGAMAGDDNQRGVQSRHEDWLAQRRVDLAKLGADAEAAAHEGLRRAALTGEGISAGTSTQARAWGAQLIDSKRLEGLQRKANGAREQLLAGARGAQDAFTFKLGDRAYAGVGAAHDALGGGDLRHAYHRRMDVERARDRYDETHYPVARTAGGVAGTGLQIAAFGPAEGLAVGGARLAEATPMVARELGALGGVGAAGGVGSQIVGDIARGRLGSGGDYLGAAVGGAVSAYALRSGRGAQAGAIDGGVTSVAQDLANGRTPSATKARQAALAGAVLGGIGGFAGRRYSNGLSRGDKAALGEEGSRLRTWSRGDQTLQGGKTREYLKGGGYTVPDQRTLRNGVPQDIVESKFGRASELSRRQKQAYREGLPNYRVDQFLPRDVGAAAGLGLTWFGDGLPYRNSESDF
jgi:hypothetical protein